MESSNDFDSGKEALQLAERALERGDFAEYKSHLKSAVTLLQLELESAKERTPA